MSKIAPTKSSELNIMKDVSAIPGHIYWKDKKGKYLWCNDAQVKSFGFKSVNQVIGKTDFDLLTHETAKQIWENDLRIITTGKTELLEEESIFNGQKFVMLSHKSPIKDDSGKIIGVVCNSIDMSSRKAQHVELAQDNHDKTSTLENIVINLPAHIYWKDRDGKILGCNDKSAISFGLRKAQELIGKTIFDLVDKESAQKISKSDLHIMQTGQVEIIEESVIYSGNKHTFISHKSPFKDPKTGEIKGVLGVSIDITRQKELERAYMEKALELTQALEVKQDFLNNMSHEVRTPLQGIVGMAEALDGAWENISDEVKRNCMKSFLEARDRLMNLLSNLLDLSRFTKGKANFEFKYHDIKFLLFEVVSEFQYITQPIDLRVSAGVDTYICCDDWRFKQVIRNVIANAVKHGGKDKPITITLTMHREKETKYIKIAIKDEGVGVPEDELDLIFEPFHESKRTKRMSGGTGMGLALCKEIITAHRGAMWVENNKKCGSIFLYHYSIRKTKPAGLYIQDD